jgi:hypothetical protein
MMPAGTNNHSPKLREQMDKRRILSKPNSICFLACVLGTSSLLLSACGLAPTPISTPTPTQPPILTTKLEPQAAIAPSIPVLQLSATPNCTNDLKFLSDITIPDYSIVAPGSRLDKQWLVENNGDCNWDVRYRLRLVSGNLLDAQSEQALYPARAGTQANLRIFFSAPQQDGDYVSEWQAYDPNGVQFGESFVIKITVQH